MNPQRQEGYREKASRKPKWKNYDFTMFLSNIAKANITTSHGIAVKWYLRVYWLLSLSIVASFKKNRRFFCLAPTILLPSADDSFGKHRRLFCWAPWILGSFNQLHFPKESLPWLAPYNKKGNDIAGFTLTVTSRPTWKSTDSGLIFWKNKPEVRFAGLRAGYFIVVEF